MLGVIITGAITYGSVMARFKVAEKTIEGLERGRETQGARIGVVEERVANVEGRLGLGIDGRPRRASLQAFDHGDRERE